MKYNEAEDVSLYLLRSAIMCALFILSSAVNLSANSTGDIHILMIVPEDEQAIIRTPDGELRIIKSRDFIGDHIKVIKIAPGRVVLEEKTNKGMKIVTIRLHNGKQIVTKEAKPARLSKSGGVAPVVLKRDRENKSTGIDHGDSVDVATGAEESSRGKLYRWVDEQGVVHLSDKPGSSDAEEISMSNLPATNMASPEGTKKYYRVSDGYFTRGDIDVKGKLLFDGNLFSRYTSAEPNFRIKRMHEDKWFTADYEYDNKNGNFSIYGIAEGSYSLYAYVDTIFGKTRLYDGDYEGSTFFSVSSKRSPDIEVDMEGTIHLVEPQDSAMPLDSFELSCEKKTPYSGPVLFRWEPIVEDVYYTYEIYRVQCGSYKQEPVVKAKTRGTEIVFDLPPNEEDEHYRLYMYARKNERKIGFLMTYGVRSKSRFYSFRVVDPLLK